MNTKQALLSGSEQERTERRAATRARKSALAELKAAKTAAIERQRAARQRRQEQRLAAALRGTQVQEVTRPSKIKALSKKRRRQFMTQAELTRRLEQH